MNWDTIPGWFQWRDAQEEAVAHFPAGSRFVEVGNYLGRSLCSLAEAARSSGKTFTLIGVDTCEGSGIEGPRNTDLHGPAVAEGGGTLAGQLHRNIQACGYTDTISLIVARSTTAAGFFPDRSIDWVHLDANHSYEAVRSDIQAWLPKVKKGGWISGDDFDPEQWPGVVGAVRELLPQARPWSRRQWRWVVP